MRTVLLALVLVAAPVCASAETLNLVCRGVGSRLEGRTGYGTAFSSTGQSSSASVTTYQRREREDELLVSVDEGAARIRVPTSILPALRAGGRDGWWVLNDVQVTDEQITGRFQLNFLNRPTVRIDRRTGSIAIEGFARSDFHGTCEAFDPNARRF